MTIQNSSGRNCVLYLESGGGFAVNKFLLCDSGCGFLWFSQFPILGLQPSSQFYEPLNNCRGNSFLALALPIRVYTQVDIVCDSQVTAWLLCQTVLLWFHLYRPFPNKEGVSVLTMKTFPCVLFVSAVEPCMVVGPGPARATLTSTCAGTEEANGTYQGALERRVNGWRTQQMLLTQSSDAVELCHQRFNRLLVQAK